MAYTVIGADGKEYGPVEADQLRHWLAEGRVMPHSQVKDFMTGQVTTVAQIPGLAPPAAAPQAPPAYGAAPNPYAAYPRPAQHQGGLGSAGAQIIGSICVLWGFAILLLFLFRGAGVVSSGFALVRSFQLVSLGHKFAVPAICISVLLLIVTIIGTVMRYQSHAY